MSQEAQSRLPEWVSKPAVRIAAGAVALGGSLAGCGGDDAGDIDPGFTPNPGHTLTVEPTATSTPIIEVTSTPTATPTLEPTATPTERVQNVPCEILPQEYCDDAELVYYTNGKGVRLEMLGFKLPEGTPIYSTNSGTLVKGSQSTGLLVGDYAIIANAQNPTDSSMFFGNLSISVGHGEKVAGNTQIGSVRNSENEVFGKYNFLFRINTIGPDGQPTSNKEGMSDLFPGIFNSQPSLDVSEQVGNTGTKVGDPIYSNSKK